ncbi:hypothetical protein PEC311524_03790 [Pectobacterium carotovorum subsp. carotovorum]|nr:hypothetical protein PEC311524_03790 [Pectobacterium carotovorum subsp. carotovorum]
MNSGKKWLLLPLYGDAHPKSDLFNKAHTDISDVDFTHNLECTLCGIQYSEHPSNENIFTIIFNWLFVFSVYFSNCVIVNIIACAIHIIIIA